MSRLILASASPTRRALLKTVGLEVDSIAPEVDEAPIKQAARRDGLNADQAVERLARAKAGAVASIHPHARVIAADQILELDGAWLDKPPTLRAARGQLMALRGRSHHLVSGVVVQRGPETLWSHLGRARLTMWDFDARFLDAYLAAAGPTVTESVGGYQVEGPGARLFSAIEGDWFTILGLPLLPLLAFLRGDG